jgi:hypothetical protein
VSHKLVEAYGGRRSRDVVLLVANTQFNSPGVSSSVSAPDDLL